MKRRNFIQSGSLGLAGLGLSSSVLSMAKETSLSDIHFSVVVEALPKAETAYKSATTNKTNLRPYLSAGLPAINAPITVPINAEEIVNPCQKEFN